MCRLWFILSHKGHSSFFGPSQDIVARISKFKTAADINAKSVEGGTALLVAIEQHNEDVVDYLLAHGANANDKLSVEPGLTALCMAAQRGYLRILKALLDAGADTEKRAGDGSTALVNAAFKGHDDIACELIKAGADKRARSAGMTAENQYRALRREST